MFTVVVISGFVRFLRLMATYDFKNAPLIVDFNGELTPKTFADVPLPFLFSYSPLS